MSADVVDIGKLDVDSEERPLMYVSMIPLIGTDGRSPPKVRGIRIIENPFDDIVPRITAAERKAQYQARMEARIDMEMREKRSKAKK